MTNQQFKCLAKAQFKADSIEAWLVRLVCSVKGCKAFDKLNDIVQHGCISGCVSELIYYNDTLKFYTRFEEQIWEHITEFRTSTGLTMGQFLDSFSSSLEDPLTFKNNLAWFAVEHTAHKLLHQYLDGGNCSW